MARKKTTSKTPARKTSKTSARKSATPAAYDAAMEEFIGRGNEEMGSDDLSTPFLLILQPLSPQVEEIEGAKPGSLFVTVGERVFDGGEEGVQIVPCHFQSRWIEWVPRDAGGGFVRQYEPGEEPPGAAGNIKVTLENGNDCVKTHLQYVLLLPPGEEPQPVVLSCAGTALTPSAKLNSALAAATTPRGVLPRFASIWRLTTHKRKNDLGMWYTWNAEQEYRLQPSESEEDSALFFMAAAFQEAVRSDQVELKMEHAAPRSDAAAPAEEEGGDEIPF